MGFQTRAGNNDVWSLTTALHDESLLLYILCKHTCQLRSQRVLRLLPVATTIGLQHVKFIQRRHVMRILSLIQGDAGTWSARVFLRGWIGLNSSSELSRAQSQSKDERGWLHSFHDHRTWVGCNETNWLITNSHGVLTHSSLPKVKKSA